MKTYFSKLTTALLIAIFIGTSVFHGGEATNTTSYPITTDEPERGYNPETGRLVFIGSKTPIYVPGASGIQSMKVQDSSMVALNTYGPEFGLTNPSNELRLLKTNGEGEDKERSSVRYQQLYRNIPVLAGELIVNMNGNGDLLSMSGEVSPNISLPTQPTIDSAQAADAALGAMAKWYQKSSADFIVSNPELWIFDESILKPSTRPVELVWRMEVTAVDDSMPVRELVLVNAQKGSISLHFNQIDTAWDVLNSDSENQDNRTQSGVSLQSSTWPLYFEIALDETRGWIYGSDSAGNKIDVISTTTLQLVKSITLANGSSPKGIALSPDGSELVIAQSGVGSILFVNPDTNSTNATIIPDVSVGPNKPWDVIYGRAGRLYSTGNPGSGGLDYIHVIDTSSHTEVSKSSHIIRSAPRLSISADNNTLYANSANFSPQKIYKYDVSTDTIPNPTSTPHTSVLSSDMHIIEPGSGYIFTDTGQIWSSDLKAKIGSTGVSGEVVYIPGRNAIAVAASNNNSVVFVDSNNFYTLSTYTLQGPMGALIAQSDGNKLFVSTSSGIATIDLTSFPPGIPGTLPTGALPYSDIVIDEANGVLYGSNTTGHKIDVISASTLQVVNEIRMVNGGSPKGMDLSPDGSELAVALSGSNQIAFIDTSSLTVSASVIPDESDFPFDVKYGRSGRLYSSGSPYSGGFEYIHVIDTTTHTNVSRSGFIVRAGPSLAVSADNDYLLANEQFSPNKLYKFDITTDTIPSPTSTQHTSGFTANTYILLSDETKVFTSTGQVWSYPVDLSTSTQMGTFSASGYLVEIQGLNLVAVLGNSGSVKFVNTTDYLIASSITIPSVSSFGPGIVNSDDSKLFLNTDIGILAVNLDPSRPSSILVESGSSQSAPLLTQFSQPLKAKVTNFLGQPLNGKTVTFTAPASGASGTFDGTNTNTTTAITDANGIATSSAFTSNNANGSYVISATVADLAGSADFRLANGVQIRTYTTHNTMSLPGTLLCTEATSNCTAGSDPHADGAHKFAIGTYDFYITNHSRKSIDNNNLPIISTVHYASGYNNAYWSGAQMVYGDAYSYPMADDVVAHELTHGVTQYESNLFYYYQSGAINESFSDLWGEYYDQTNGLGNDTASVKWLIGEDVSGAGAIRNMSNPPAYGDPDKMSSPNYYEGAGDSGGVHYNSGVNNKAIFLMVDGGTFNGKTVTSLGWEKTGAIYYEAQTNLLSSGADYLDLYYALQQACTNLIGQHGITSGNCVEVKDAVDAVEMNMQPAPNFNTDAPLCSTAETTPKITFADDLESGTSNWTFNNGTYARWQVDSPFYGLFAKSGLHSLYADDWPGEITDATAQLASLVIPPNAYLHFAHAYNFETDTPIYWDGGVIEYSTNSGSTWFDAGSLIDYNGYKGTIFNGAGNPLSSRPAFAGTSHGYISTRLNLASLAGETVTFRWRMGLDEAADAGGWWVDDVRIYTCVAGPDVSSITRADANPTVATSVDFTVTFSEAVTGVDTSAPFDDFALTTEGDVTGASILSVSGSGTTYTVTVSTGSGSGTIRLDITDDDTVINSNSIPLGGAGVGNGDFNSGEAYSIAPINDDFGSAKDVLTLLYTDSMTTVGATSAVDDPPIPQCNIVDGGKATVWYKYTPSTDAAISLDTKTADYDTFIAVWTGTRNDLTHIACNDDTGETKQSAVAFRVTGGETYYIEIGQP